jgi:hypothetical protein
MRRTTTTMRGYKLFLLLLLSTCTAVFGGTMPRGMKMSSETNGYSFTFILPEYRIFTETALGKEFDKIDIDGFGVNSDVGCAALPQLSFNILIPDIKSIPFIKESKGTITDKILAKELYPVQQPWPKNKPLSERPFSYDNAYYESEGKKEPLISISEPFIIAGVAGVTVTIRPFSYNPKAKKVQVYETVNLSITIPNRTKQSSTKALSTFDATVNSVFVNSSDMASTVLGTKASGNYLIISAPAFVSACAPFVTYRQDQGYTVTVVSTASAGSTTAAIKAYIQGRYDNPTTRPTNILLVGDVADIPAWPTTTQDAPWTDLYYTTLAGTDYFPDANIGRFSATTSAQVTNMINKTIYMETHSTDLAKRATFLASTDRYTTTEGTHNYVIDTDMIPHEYTCQKRYYHSGATTQQVLADLALGQIFCVYSGHGFETGWADGPPVSTSDVQALTNTVFPFVYAFTCLSGSYASTPECFAETWLRSVTGAASYWGSSVTSYWDEDDILERALFDAIYGAQNTANGPSFLAGKMAVYNRYGNTSMVQRYFEQYNLFGDPALVLYNNWVTGVALDLQSLIPQEVSGNNDGIVNPGEQINLQTVLTNRGTENAVDASAILTTTDSYVTINDNSSQYGTIAARGGIGQALDQFTVTIAQDCPTPRTVLLELHITDNAGHSFTSASSVTVYTSSTVRGHVYSRGDNAPMANSTVRWAGPASGSCTTDAAGQYSFVATDGTYQVVAEATNFTTSAPQTVSVPPSAMTNDFQLSRPQLTVAPAQVNQSLQISTTANATLTASNAGYEPLTYSINIEEYVTKTVPAESLYSADHFVPLAKGAPDNRKGLPAVKGHGGPDQFGYRWIDSDETGGPAYQWQEISTTGQRLSLTGDDIAASVTIGFPFPFYGNTYNSMNVCSNGFVSFGTSTTSYSNSPLPSSGTPNNMIAPFWDDLYIRSTSSIYFQRFSDRAIIQFQDLEPYSGTGLYTYQVVLYMSGKIQLYYKSMSGLLSSSTVGIENATGTDGLQVAYNTSYIHNNLAVTFQTAPDWISVTPESGTISALQSQLLNVRLSAEELVAGTYNCTILLNHNDPTIETPKRIPVTMTVVDAPVIRLDPARVGISALAADRAGQLILEGTILGAPAAGKATGSRYLIYLK